jgi:hypothetical protein
MTAKKNIQSPWTKRGMEKRREWIFENVRRSFGRLIDKDGNWMCPPAANKEPDWRVIVQVSLPYLMGDKKDRILAERFLLHPVVQKRINACSFTTEYILAVILGAGSACPEGLREKLLKRIGKDLIHYAKKDLQHHGYNDNHVTLATASLALGGELTGNAEAVDEARANLMNFRDTFLRRGFMHETNDCYIPHTIYSNAIIAEFAKDREIRELAKNCEARIWADWIGHWHPNLCRKPGPSARDYTGGRLDPLVITTGLWCIFGEKFGQPAYPPSEVFSENRPAEHFFDFNGDKHDGHWNLGFLARICAHGYHVPESVAPMMYKREYPHVIRGTHETGHFNEGARKVVPGPGGTTVIEGITIPEVIPFSAREIYTYQYQESEWAMGTASQRMIGGCPNNNWGVYYRKKSPLAKTSDQGLLFCSYTVNDKPVTGKWTFQMDSKDKAITQEENVEHWFDNGRYAGIQHERSSIVLYRPRVIEKHAITSLATTFVYPLCWNNKPDHVWLGDTEIKDFKGESKEICDIFIQDGPLFIGLRPLMSRPQKCGVRIKAVREKYWGLIHVYAYKGKALDLSEMDLCRIDGGFVCEVATKKDFKSIDAFRKWFRQAQVLDEQMFFMRQVRYHRKGLDLGMRWDLWNDNIMYRTMNGREYPMPKFECSGIDSAKLPWLTGSVKGMDNFSWAVRQSKRPLAKHCTEPGRVTGPFVKT